MINITINEVTVECPFCHHTVISVPDFVEDRWEVVCYRCNSRIRWKIKSEASTRADGTSDCDHCNNGMIEIHPLSDVEASLEIESNKIRCGQADRCERVLERGYM